jgi:hypothetical protein
VAAIDRFLPEWDANEVHGTVLDVPPERALAAALAAPGAPDAIVRVLLRLRGLPHGGSIDELLRGIGFETLAREDDEVVFGAAGKPWRPGAALGLFGEAVAGTVRIAANFRAEPAADGRTVLSTETRIAAVDEDARRAFRRYWRLIGPFSALIRRRWLAAVRRSLASSA